jgi:hypothetical protein
MLFIHGSFFSSSLMASQKLTNCCVAAIALAASTYVSTPHCSTIARLAFGAFCLAIDIDAFLRKHQVWSIPNSKCLSPLEVQAFYRRRDGTTIALRQAANRRRM